MNQTIYSWLIIVILLLGANLPFLTSRYLGIVKVNSNTHKNNYKSLAIVGVELLSSYIIVGSIAAYVEYNLGTLFIQRWEFFAATLALFITCAFPGFTWRYLRRRI